ncbi:hypothetical protein OG912_25130 [Streptomyces sp. NBC_00464]|uniref:hypothetical protein n=1 Tax=Streptomyces sp. NBC_00464 TaxID=2975751 RepID=UPI002E176A75
MARYVTARELGSKCGENGQFVVRTLTDKSIGRDVGAISLDGAVKWREDGRTSPQVATTGNTAEGPEVDSTTCASRGGP